MRKDERQTAARIESQGSAVKAVLHGDSKEKLPILLIVLLLGLLIRLAHGWTIARTAFLKITFISTNSDPYAFWHWAQTILAGDLLGRETYHPYFTWMKELAPLETWYRWWGGKAIFQQAPLYPYGVAGLLALSYNSLPFVILVQLLLGAVQPLVMFGLARRLYDDDRVGLVAAALTAGYGPFIFHQGTLLRDWLPPLLEPLALLGVLRAGASGGVQGGLLGGAFIGIATLTKESAFVLLPIGILWLVLENRGAVRRAAPPAAALLLGFLLALSPLVARNYLVGVPLFALSNRATEGLIEGNAADTYPVGLHHPLSMKGILERSGGRLGGVIRETLGTYQGDWLGFANIQLLKLRGIADPLEVPNNVGFAYGIEISPVLRFMLRYGGIFPLGVTGFLLSPGARRKRLVMALYGLFTVAGISLAPIMARYRLVLIPVLIVYGAAGLVWLYDAVRTGQKAKGIMGLSLLLSVALVQHVLIPIGKLRDIPYYSVHHADYIFSAQIYASEGRPDRAVAEL